MIICRTGWYLSPIHNLFRSNWLLKKAIPKPHPILARVQAQTKILQGIQCEKADESHNPGATWLWVICIRKSAWSAQGNQCVFLAKGRSRPNKWEGRNWSAMNAGMPQKSLKKHTGILAPEAQQKIYRICSQEGYACNSQKLTVCASNHW